MSRHTTPQPQASRLVAVKSLLVRSSPLCFFLMWSRRSLYSAEQRLQVPLPLLTLEDMGEARQMPGSDPQTETQGREGGGEGKGRGGGMGWDGGGWKGGEDGEEKEPGR